MNPFTARLKSHRVNIGSKSVQTRCGLRVLVTGVDQETRWSSLETLEYMNQLTMFIICLNVNLFSLYLEILRQTRFGLRHLGNSKSVVKNLTVLCSFLFDSVTFDLFRVSFSHFMFPFVRCVRGGSP